MRHGVSQVVSTQAAATSLVPPGSPQWITAELVRLTIKVWQPHYKSVLSPEDAVTILLGVSRLFGVFVGR